MPYLPQETRGYVPAFVAVTYIMHYAAEHNLNPVRYTGLPSHIDTLHLKGPLSLPALAGQLGMTAQELCLLNPQFKQQEIPRSFESYPIRLPVFKVAEFERNRTNVLAALQPAPVIMPAQDGGSSPMLAQGSQGNQPASPPSGEWIMKPTRYHSVRRGETLSTIGRRYGITVQSLRNWNHLSGNNIGVGQKLIVQRTKVPTGAPVVAEQMQASRPANPTTAPATSGASNTSATAQTTAARTQSAGTGIAAHAGSQPGNSAGQTATTSTSAPPSVQSTDLQTENSENKIAAANTETVAATRQPASTVRRAPVYNYYTVRKGDTLWDIAQRKGITVAELQKANKLTRSSRLQPGQKLKIAAG